MHTKPILSALSCWQRFVDGSTSLTRSFILVVGALSLISCGSNGTVAVDATPDTTESQASNNTGTSPLPPSPVIIINQPQSRSVAAGNPVTFSVEVDGTGPFTYQWRKDGLTIPGANLFQLTISSADSGDAGNYAVQISNSAGIEISNDAVLTVSQVTPEPSPVPEPDQSITITRQPASLTITEGSAAQFSVEATGSTNLQYQWLKNGQPISGATQAVLSFTSTSQNDSASYSVVISNASKSQTSLSALLTIEPKPVAVAITQAPQSVTADKGTQVGFSVSASGTGPLQYQWLKNGVAISGQNSNMLTLTNIGPSDAGAYSVQVSNSISAVQSQTATLTVNSTYAVALNWSIPTLKQDGSPLALYEIGGYAIQYGSDTNNLSQSVTINSASTTSITLSALSAGTYYLRIATLDASMIPGEFSQVFSFTLL